MAKTESHIPKLRFAGFTDPWGFFSLGEFFSQTSQYCDENDNIELWSLTVEKGLTPKTARYERSFLVKKDDGYKKIEPNEFVYNPMNMTIGAVGYNYTNKILAVSGYYVTMQIAKEQSISFFRSWLVSPNALGLYKQYATGSLIEKQRVQYVTFAKIKYYFPLLEEQTKIGDFFQKIDQVIELQQKALETAQYYKKSMLQKMFPQKGEKVPKVRFKGFSGNWNEKSLGEVSKICTGSKDVQDAINNGVYPFFIRSDEIRKINSYSFDGEAILIPGEGRLGEIFHYINGKFDYHQRVYKISDFIESDGLFILNFMKLKFKEHALKFTVKATVDSLRLPTIKNFILLMPKLEEQQKIGAFFQKLDKQIEQHEKKLESYQSLKKAMLQRMFV